MRVTIFTRHSVDCERKEERDYTRCRCAKWLEYYDATGTQVRKSAHTRDLSEAQKTAADIEAQYNAIERGHASKNWYTPGLREIVRFHFRKYTLKPDEAIQALFPVSRPVANAVVLDCKPWTEKWFALTLDQVRIITQPKPVLDGMISVPWHTERTKELASALARARVLEGVEKNAVYQEFELMALRSKINTWLKGQGLEQFALTPPR